MRLVPGRRACIVVINSDRAPNHVLPYWSFTDEAVKFPRQELRAVIYFVGYNFLPSKKRDTQ